MQIIYVDTRYKPKRKSRKEVTKIPKFEPEFRPLRVTMPAAYRSNEIPSLNSSLGGIVASRVKQQTYSGERTLLGIGVLHKSCLQPIFSEAEAVEIAHMRR